MREEIGVLTTANDQSFSVHVNGRSDQSDPDQLIQTRFELF